MRWVTCHQGQLQLRADGRAEETAAVGAAGWEAWDGRGVVAARAVHELLFDPGRGHPAPMFPALVLARGVSTGGGAMVWCDPERVLYPPAVQLGGVPVGQLCVVRPRSAADVVWAVGECLQTRGVRAVVARLPSRLSRAEARRLQLAAERGGGVGLFLRPVGPGSDVYAAATRWLVAPARGERDVQRWKVKLVHGHGRHLDESFLLEKRRGSDEANLVRVAAVLPDRPAVSTTAAAG